MLHKQNLAYVNKKVRTIPPYVLLDMSGFIKYINSFKNNNTGFNKSLRY